jgi:short-subunit dehydrogenase
MRGYNWLERLLFPRTKLDLDRLTRAMQGKTVLITGASSGIGEQLAYILGRCEVHLLLTGRNEDKLKEIKAAIEGGAGNTRRTGARAAVSVFGADLRDEEQLARFLDFVSLQAVPPDIFVSNAGLSIRRSIYDSLDRPHDFARTMAINYTAPVRLLLAFIPSLQRVRGQVINVSTINAALIPFPKWAAYQASKAAFDVWLRSVSPELNGGGIATTSVYLPLVRTPMIAPTEAYAKVPAMSAEHAASMIAKSMYTRKRTIRPWWLPLGQLASLLGRGAWERFAPSRMQRREER